MNYDELENEVFNLLEKKGSFLQAQINISRINYDNWLIEANIEETNIEKRYQKTIAGNGRTKKDALEDLYNSLKEE